MDLLERQEAETEAQWIQDKDGRFYRLTVAEGRDLWIFKVFDERKFVGQANCIPRLEELFLSDLRIQEAVRSPERGFSALVRTITGIHKQPTNYRGRGLGGNLLMFIIRRATDRGLRQISGELALVDLKANPLLPDWYRRFGFEVTMNNATSGSIRLELEPPAPPEALRCHKSL